MKKLIKIFSLLLVLSGSAIAATIPGDFESEKTKSYTKTYPIGSSDKILLDNSFGEMKISTWSKNEIKVDVIITSKAGTDERAQKIMDMINIEDGKNGSEIFFKTHIKNENGDWNDDHKKNRDHNNNVNSNENTNFKINYIVYLPANATLNAINQFGPMSIGDYDGILTLDSKFGSLTTGKLSQPKKVTVQFGHATIESMNNGKLSVQFSRAQVNKLSGEVEADINQSHGVKINLDNNIKKLDINNNFSDILLDADKNLSANFNIRSSFGSFSNETAFPVNKDRDNENRYVRTNETYSGKAGGGSTPVTIKNNFGHITLGHDMAFDVNDKTRHKSERKTRV